MNRRALTLIELLVVLVIISMVTAAAIPMMAPQGDARRQREAARSVASFLQGARSRAIETGRPVGVAFEWFPPGNATAQQFSMNLVYGQSPPPYAGDTTASLCDIAATPPLQTVDASRYIEFRLDFWDFNPTLVRVGDQVRFNYQGFYWPITGPDSNNDGVVDLQSSGLQYVEIKMTADVSEYMPRKLFLAAIASPMTPPTPYQVFRQISRSASGPLQLPEGAVVDVTLCGQGSAAIGVDRWALMSAGVKPADFVITFSPDGSIDQSNYLADPDGPAEKVEGYITADGPSPAPTNGPVTSPIFLMIGKREKVIQTASKTVNVSKQFKDDVATLSPTALRQKYNFKDADNFWVVVNPSGTIVTGEIATSNPTNGTADDDFLECLNQSRNIARTGEGVGGR